MSNRDIASLKNELAGLPRGSVARKRIAGKDRYYRQWVEAGRTKSEYLSADRVEEVRTQIERRRRLEKELRTLGVKRKSVSRDSGRTKTGAALRDWTSPVANWEHRAVFTDIMKFLRSSDKASKVLLVFGIRRTGKTTMLQQAVRSLTEEEFARAAYIKAKTTDTMADMDDRLSMLYAKGIRLVFIDEVTLISDFIDGAALFSDVYAPMGMRIVLSGTDSLGFWMSIHQELFDRAYLIHTTFVPFREYSRLLKIDDIDEYITYGGLLKSGEKDLDDPRAYEPDASFRDVESTRRYIDTAIAENIQHSLSCCQDGRYFASLGGLYRAGELTNAINRVIEDMNHAFLASVLTRPFRSSDLGLATRNLMNDRDASRRRRLDRMLDQGRVTRELMGYLKIIDRGPDSITVTDEDAAAVREYLRRLELIRDCPVRIIRDGKVFEDSRVLFSQPGMRFCQAEALVQAILKDSSFAKYPADEQAYVTGRILDDVRGRMLEDIVLLETLEVTPGPRNLYEGREVFKLQFAVGEYDMVIRDLATKTCALYEVKHARERIPAQCRHLLDEEKLASVRKFFGEVTDSIVLYRGEDATLRNGIRYQNVNTYLKRLRSVVTSEDISEYSWQ